MSIRYDIPQIAFELHEHTGEGYVMLARETYKYSKTWQNLNPVQKVIMITLIMRVNHTDGEWWDKWAKEWVPIKRGQVITSLQKLAEDCGPGVTVQNVRTALKTLEKMKFLTNQSTKQNRLITLVNYDFYQTGDSYLTKQPTKHQQSNHKPLTTNKNEKNVKNVKKDLKTHYAEFVTLTKAEYQKLVTEHGEPLTRLLIETLDNYKGSKNKKYASDYRAILSWVVKRVTEENPKALTGKPKTNEPRGFANIRDYIEEEGL